MLVPNILSTYQKTPVVGRGWGSEKITVTSTYRFTELKYSITVLFSSCLAIFGAVYCLDPPCIELCVCYYYCYY